MTVHLLLPLLPSDSPLTDRTGGLWRIASSFLRSFSTASQNPTSATASPSSASKKPKRKKKKKKNLFEVAQFLPNWGLGYRMAKTHWVGVSYQITKINLYKLLQIGSRGSSRTPIIQEGSSQIVAYARGGRSSQRMGDFSMALAFALENARDGGYIYHEFNARIFKSNWEGSRGAQQDGKTFKIKK